METEVKMAVLAAVAIIYRHLGVLEVLAYLDKVIPEVMEMLSQPPMAVAVAVPEGLVMMHSIGVILIMGG